VREFDADGAMVQASEQAERCRRLARDNTDPDLRDSLLRLADEYAARAATPEGQAIPVRKAGSDDRSAT
jgi:hypothetical protein